MVIVGLGVAEDPEVVTQHVPKYYKLCRACDQQIEAFARCQFEKVNKIGTDADSRASLISHN